MKNLKYNYSSLAVLTLLLLAGCLNEKPAEFAGTPPIVEFLDGTTGNSSPVSVVAVPNTVMDSVFVRINITKTLSSNLTVTIGLDPSGLSVFNSNNSSSPLLILPTSYYSIPSNTVTIKAGQNVALFPVLVNPTLIANDGISNYALPLIITDAKGQTISGNNNEIILNITVPTPNVYDGNYLRTGTLTIAGGTPIQINETVRLYTYEAYVPYYGYYYSSATYASHLNNTSYSFLIAVFDPGGPNNPNGGPLKDGNYQLNFIPDAPGATVAINQLPGAPSEYNPTTGTFTMRYHFFDSKNRDNQFVETWVKQ